MSKYKSTNREGRICKSIKVIIKSNVSLEAEKGGKVDNNENNQIPYISITVSKYTLKY